MRQSGFLFSAVVSSVFLVSLLSGCLSVSSTPNSRFFMLPDIDKGQITREFSFPSGKIIALGPLEIPQYQDRPQIVTQDKNRMLTFSQFDRWGEPLDQGLRRLIMGNLTAMLPGATLEMFPCNFAIPLDYQIIIDVIQLESQLDKDLFFVAQWSVIDVPKKQMLLSKRWESRVPIDAHNYTGLIKAISKACSSFSEEIAAVLSGLAGESDKTENDKRGDL